MNSNNVADDSATSAVDRPLVTFCIMAFNQERYIEEAMRAALAQTYEKLEIIVSDDRSSDGTWNRIQTIAAAYKGPHRLRVRQSASNRGVLHHLLDIADMASGRLLVVSAADDVSLPQRTAVMVSVWCRNRYAAAFADYAVIDENGRELEKHYRFSDAGFSPRDYLPESKALNIHGASSVYDIDQLRLLGRPSSEDVVLFEDTWLSLAFTFTGGCVVHIPEVLVQYRRHSNSITNFGNANASTRQAIEQADLEWQKRSAAFGKTLASFKRWHQCQSQKMYLLPPRTDRDIDYFTHVGKWNDLSFFSRINTIRFASRTWMLKNIFFRILPKAVRIEIKKFRKFS